jgi:hypothetical protein
MEFWNPDDGSVAVVVDQLPTEIGSLTALQETILFQLLLVVVVLRLWFF